MSLNHAELSYELKNFLEYLRTTKGSATHTCRSYEADLSLFLEYWAATAPTAVLSDQLIEQYLKYVESKSMRVASIARKISCFNSLRKYLSDMRGYAAQERLRRPHVPHHAVTYLDDETLSALCSIEPKKLNTPQPYRDKAIISVLAATGITCSELVNLKVSDISLEKNSLIVMGKRNRTLEFTPQTSVIVSEYLRKSARHKALPQEPLFANPRGGTLTSRTIQRICTIISNNPLVQKSITPHILRHSYAMRLMRNGTNQTLIQEKLGFKTRASSEKYIQTLR